MNNDVVKKLLEENFQKAIERRKIFILEWGKQYILEGLRFYHLNKPIKEGIFKNITE